MLSRSLFLRSLGITVVLFVIFFIMFVPRYLSNDDVGMTIIASGIGGNGSPNEHLLFTNVLIGLMLKSLYTRVPFFPWYS